MGQRPGEFLTETTRLSFIDKVIFFERSIFFQEKVIVFQKQAGGALSDAGAE